MAKRETRIRDPHHEDPQNYESRTDWQRALWKSKIDQGSKRYIKQLENLVTDNWEATFDGLWETIEQTLDRGLNLTDDVLVTYITDSTRKQLRNLDREQWDSAFNGLWLGGKEHSYKLTGYGDSKREAQIIDTLEEQAQLARLRETALQKVKTITNEELKAAILERLSEPGASSKNPVQLANQIIREERQRLEQSKNRETLKEQIKELYDDQLWKVQRITRTESANAYWLSMLTGYKEQGIEMFKFHSHTYEQNTCAICLALDGTEHAVDDWLSAGRYPLSSNTHPNCRCWPTPIISHVTLESMEELYEDEPNLFAPGETVFDNYQIEMEDVVKQYKTIYGLDVENMPVEHEQEIRDAIDAIQDTPYQQYQPDQLRFVKDVGATDEFKKAVPEPVLGQVTAWTAPDNTLLLSQFSTDNGNTVSAAIIREWAGRAYDEDKSLQGSSQEMYGRDDIRPGDISPQTIQKLIKTFDPWTMMRVQLVDSTETVALEKRLRDAPEKTLQKVLDSLGLSVEDVDTIVRWRTDRPVWDMSGKYMPQGEQVGSFNNKMVNRVAEEGPREMFVESVVAYVTDPWSLYRRDPDLYSAIKVKVFDGKEFREV